MTQKNNEEFRVDSPIESSQEDKFSRTKYARNLAKILMQPREECCVLGISGSWGSGKTFLKNLVVEAIEPYRSNSNANNAVPYIVEFEPWLYSGSDNIISLLFYTISTFVRPKHIWIEKVRDKIYFLTE